MNYPKYLLTKRLAILLLSLFVLVMTAMVAGCKTSTQTIAQPTATSATIQITLQNAKFGVSQPLGVLIKNTGKKDVYALDGQAACTFLQVQQYDTQKKDWVAVDRCRDVVPPTSLVIRAGASEPFTLAPVSSADPNAWAPGTYRIALAYSAQPDGKTDMQMAYSQGFTIASS